MKLVIATGQMKTRNNEKLLAIFIIIMIVSFVVSLVSVYNAKKSACLFTEYVRSKLNGH